MYRHQSIGGEDLIAAFEVRTLRDKRLLGAGHDPSVAEPGLR